MEEIKKRENDEILTIIEDYINTKITTTKIGDISYEFSHCIPNSEVYDGYLIEDFLVLYKIDKLVALNIISQKTSVLLKQLFFIKQNINRKIAEIINENISLDVELPDVSILVKKIEIIDSIFEKYHLNDIQVDFDSIINSSIKAETYSDCYNEHDLSDVLKRVL